MLTFLPGKEAILPWELYSFTRKLTAPPLTPLNPGPAPQGKKIILPKPPITPTGHPKQGTIPTPQGQTVKVLGFPPGFKPLNLPRRPVQPPGKAPLLHTPHRSSQGSSNEEPNPKWVINLSNKPLIPAQRSVLAKGPNFAVTPRQPPNLEYITAIEAACTKLSQQDAEELRADVNRVLRSSHPPKPNLTKAQNIALRELKRDRDRIVLTADKGVAMVVMDKQDYINKANQLLNQNTYKVISKDPTTTIKNKLINILRVIKTKTGLGSYSYKAMYPTGCVPTQVLWPPQDPQT